MNLENTKNIDQKTYKLGELEIVTGPMFSGKTTELIKIYNKYAFLKKKILVVNWAGDKRYAASGITTDSMMCDDLDTIDCKIFDVIILDEAQFFKNLKKNVLHWCEDMNIIVIVGGLEVDFKRDKMGEILDLQPFANKVTRLTALCCKCRDGTVGLFSSKISNFDNIYEIGNEQYIAVCRYHYLNNS